MTLDRSWRPAAALLLLAAFLARVAYLQTIPGVSGDEAWYGIQMGRLLDGQAYDARTPTGLPMNPFYAYWEAPLLWFRPPSPWILRAPAVVSSLLAIFLGYRLLRRPLGEADAVLSALTLAVLPVAIDFSRVGWDQSQAALFGVLAVAFALRAQPVPLLLSAYGFLWVHPANIFAIPAVSAAFLAAAWSRWPRRRVWTVLGTVAGTIALLMMARGGNTQPRFLAERDAWFSLSRWLENLTLLGRIVSGESFIECHTGPIDPTTRLIRGAFTAAIVAVLIPVGGARLIRERSRLPLAMVVGTIVSVLGVILAVDPSALAPRTERYAVGLTAPIAVSLGCLIAAALPRTQPSRRWALAGFWILAWLPLTDFGVSFLARTVRTGGDSHAAFWAGPIDPKQAAVQFILADLPNAPAATVTSLDPRRLVITEDWWTTMPLTYFKQGRDDRLRILQASENDETRLRECRRYLEMGAYLVGFAEGPLTTTLERHFPPEELLRWEAPRYGGRPAVVVYRRIGITTAPIDPATP